MLNCFEIGNRGLTVNKANRQYSQHSRQPIEQTVNRANSQYNKQSIELTINRANSQ